MTQYRAFALDYDGTLTEGRRPAANVLHAVAAARERGQRVVLVTGRILSELRADFPDVDDAVDAVVAENGAVLSVDGADRPLSLPVDPALYDRLAVRGVDVRRGQVLLAMHADDDVRVLREVASLGLDAQLVRNRDALMVLPGGVTKATGLRVALETLHRSPHNTIAVGDADNDHALLDACAVGVAVANAVESLKRHADLVLPERDGAGVARLLHDAASYEQAVVRPRRWEVPVGNADDGTRVTVPGGGANVLITGASGSGKSFLAGTLVEGLVLRGYSVLVMDAEGDHVALGRLAGTAAVGGEGLPGPAHLVGLLQSRQGSVVLDASLLAEEARERYLRKLALRVEAQRAQTGIPHWIVADEAHLLPWDARGDPSPGLGTCAITYQPQLLREEIVRGLDLVLAMPGGGVGSGDAIDFLTRVSGAPADEVAAHLGPGGRAVAVAPGTPRLVPFDVAPRSTEHVRHWRKYTDGELPAPAWFDFRADTHGPVWATAANLAEFCSRLRSCPAEVLGYHARRQDLSRWLAEAIQDHRVAGLVRAIEQDLDSTAPAQAEQARAGILRALEDRYLR